MKLCAIAVCLLPLTGLTACATVVDGTTEAVTISTTNGDTPLDSAQYDLNNGKGDWTATTPETVTLHRASAPLRVKCTKSGYAEAGQTVSSSTTGAYAGNIILGGLVGVAVDTESGAAFGYPDKIVVSMNPVPATTAPAPETSPAAPTAPKPAAAVN